MIAKQTNHGKATNNTATATARAATAKPCRRTDASATGRAGDVPAADTAEKEATVQTNNQRPNTPAPFAAKRKNAARRKEKRKAREAAQRKTAYWAKRGVPREIRAWLDAIDS